MCREGKPSQPQTRWGLDSSFDGTGFRFPEQALRAAPTPIQRPPLLDEPRTHPLQPEVLPPVARTANFPLPSRSSCSHSFSGCPACRRPQPPLGLTPPPDPTALPLIPQFSLGFFPYEFFELSPERLWFQTEIERPEPAPGECQSQPQSAAEPDPAPGSSSNTALVPLAPGSRPVECIQPVSDEPPNESSRCWSATA